MPMPVQGAKPASFACGAAPCWRYQPEDDLRQRHSRDSAGSRAEVPQSEPVSGSDEGQVAGFQHMMSKSLQCRRARTSLRVGAGA